MNHAPFLVTNGQSDDLIHCHEQQVSMVSRAVKKRAWQVPALKASLI
jgi:hypothetical protein